MKATAEETAMATRRVLSALTGIEDAQCALADGDTLSARQALQRANQAAQGALQLLHCEDPTLSPAPVPLHLLDTPATRRFLAALESARSAAEAVDRERGWVDGQGEAIGFGETLAGMALQLRVEVLGPAGRE